MAALDQCAVEIGRLDDLLWDVVRALEARSYERETAITLEVVEDETLGGARRWRLEAGPDGATCRATGGPADLTLPVPAFGAAYLGRSRLRGVVRATGSNEHRPGVLAAADALFRTVDEPWLFTFFKRRGRRADRPPHWHPSRIGGRPTARSGVPAP